MGRARNLGITGLGAGVGYLGFKALAKEGYQIPEIIVNTIDTTAEGALNILGGSFSQIEDLAPVSDIFIEELSSALVNTTLLDAGIATGVGYGAGWLGKQGSRMLGGIIGIQSEHDDKVAKIGTGIAGVIGVLGAGASAITLGAGTGGYVLGRKLGEKILGEKYAKLLGILGSVGGVGLVWGLGTGTVLGAGAVAVGGGLIWKASGGLREKQGIKRAERKARKEERQKQKRRT